MSSIRIRNGKTWRPGRKTDVYWNVHRKCWSLRQDGIVKAYADELDLCHCEFRVSKAGNKRVRKSGKKNVHATVRGYYLPNNLVGETIMDYGRSGNGHAEFGYVQYLPAYHETFTESWSDKPIHGAAVVSFKKYSRVLSVMFNHKKYDEVERRADA